MFNADKFNKINEILKKHSKSGKIIAISKNHPNALLLELGPGKVLTGLNKRILSGDNFACVNTQALIQDVLN